MSTRLHDYSALLITDRHSSRIALGRLAGQVVVPMSAVARGDGRITGNQRLSRAALGASETRTPAFMDAALRAGFEGLGLLISKPMIDVIKVPEGCGVWTRLGYHHLLPDRDCLTFLGRALSPVDAAERQHVRVFAAPLAKVTNSLKQPGSLDRLVWLSAEAACEALSGNLLQDFPARAINGNEPPVKIAFRAGRRIESPL